MHPLHECIQLRFIIKMSNNEVKVRFRLKTTVGDLFAQSIGKRICGPKGLESQENIGEVFYISFKLVFTKFFLINFIKPKSIFAGYSI